MTAAPARTRTAPQRTPSRPARPELRVVDRRRRRPRRGLVVVGSMIVVFTALLATTAFHALLAQGQQNLDRTNAKVTAAQQRYDQLRLEVDQLSAPDRIVSEAENLGMVTPSKVQPITPAPGAGATVPNVPGADGPSASSGSSDYPAVKPYLGVDQ